MGGLAMSLLGHSRLRWSRPRLVHVRFNSDSDRQPSKRDPALRARSELPRELASFDNELAAVFGLRRMGEVIIEQDADAHAAS